MSGECEICGEHALRCECHKLNESVVSFNLSENEWAMKITRDKGIIFNRKKFPNAPPDAFAQAVIDILEKCYTVKFKRKYPPYEKSNEDDE
jgi:hypothetical protein